MRFGEPSCQQSCQRLRSTSTISAEGHMAIRRSGRSADGQPTSPCPTAGLCGMAVTVLLQPGDSWMLHVATRQLEPGDVVVAEWSTECEDGFFGELLATSMPRLGRDRAGPRQMPLRRRPRAYELPRPRRAINSTGTVKVVLGWVSAPTVGANALVNPTTWSLGRHWTADIDRRPRRMRWRCRRNGPPSPRCAGA
jgi:regulator of ribonuclease E activity RraA/HMG-CHA aldolase family protein